MCKYCIPDPRESKYEGVMLSDWYCSMFFYKGIGACASCGKGLNGFNGEKVIELYRIPDRYNQWYRHFCEKCQPIHVCDKMRNKH